MITVKEVSYQEVFKNRNYMYLWLGQLISQLGDAISLIALPLLIYKITGSAISLTIAFILEAIPWIIVGPLAGVWIDKINKKYVVIATDLVRLFLILSLFFTDTIFIIYLICFLTQSSAAIFAPARSAMIPEIVQKDIYTKAISLSHMGFQTIQVVGPLLATVIIGLVGLHTAFVFDSFTFLISVSMSLMIKYKFDTVSLNKDKKNTFLMDFKAGVIEIFRNKILKYITSINLIKGFVNAFLSVGILVYVKNNLNLNDDKSDQVYGLMMALFSIGLIIGTWLIGYYEKKLNRGYLINIGLILQGSLLLTIYFEPAQIYIAIILFLSGLSSSGAMTPISVFYAENTTNEIRGRVYSVTNASIKLISLFGLFIAGVITEYMRVENLFLFIGLMLIFLTAILTYSMNGFSLLKKKS